MFKFDEQCNPRQISLTGVRAIVILALLNKKPCTFEEIKDFLIASNIVDREYSIDTIRIDLNTLKYIGCDISKATKTTENKYILRSHPFQLVFEEDEVEALAKIYKSIYKNLSIDRLIEYDNLFEKLAESVKDENIKEYFRGVSILKGLDRDLVKELLAESHKQSKLTILYAPDKAKEVNYDITLEKLGFRSDNLYIYCYNHSMKKRTFFNVSKIKKIVAKYLVGENNEVEDTVLEYSLSNYKEYQLEDSEKVIRIEGDKAIIKGAYYTPFISMQRILSFGPDCVLLSPSDIKDELIEKLQSMRSQYD